MRENERDQILVDITAVDDCVFEYYYFVSAEIIGIKYDHLQSFYCKNYTLDVNK